MYNSHYFLQFYEALEKKKESKPSFLHVEKRLLVEK